MKLPVELLSRAQAEYPKDSAQVRSIRSRNISSVQHPDGKEKQIALRNNEIIDNDLPDALINQSDTAQGSSGAPVFNNEWQVDRAAQCGRGEDRRRRPLP